MIPRWWWTGLLVLVGCSRPLGHEPAAAFRRAQQTFEQASTREDYLLAAAQFQEVLDFGVRSGVVYYNQGNAYARGGERGRALACYRQAWRYLPGHPLLRANLLSVAGTESLPRATSILDRVLFWQDWFGYPAKVTACVVAAIVTSASSLAGQWFRSRGAGRVAWLTGLVTLLLVVSAFWDWYRYEWITRGVVAAREAVARKGDSHSYEPAFTKSLSEGTEFVVVERRGEWLLARFSGGEHGWLALRDVVVYY